MIAPCGIEVKVGQVWRKDGADLTIKKVYEGWCSAVSEKGAYLASREFTNKRGGYKLVKEAPDENG